LEGLWCASLRALVPTPLMLGMGWFPDQESGLNRYFRSLLEALGGPPAVVVGPARDAPSNVCVVETHSRPAWRRVVVFSRAAMTRALDVDVVDTHFVMYAFVPVLLGLRGKPFVVHFQGPWGSESAAPSRLSVAVRLAVERFVYRRAAAVIVLSTAFKELLVRRYGVGPGAVRVVRPGVDLRRFSPGGRGEAVAALGLPRDRQVAVTARRLVPRMGIQVLLQSWAQVMRSFSGARPLLLVVGDGPLRSTLEEQARELGVSDDVRFLGKVSDGDLVAAYRAAEVAVAPSLSLEGFGLVALEALACGTPVVGTSVDGLREALMGLDPGVLVPPGDAEALAARLLGALDGSAGAPSRERCRAYAEGFSWERTAEEVREIYESVAAVGRR
jgi:glycosyltransferase involved in cell wall biosynthesis